MWVRPRTWLHERAGVSGAAHRWPRRQPRRGVRHLPLGAAQARRAEAQLGRARGRRNRGARLPRLDRDLEGDPERRPLCRSDGRRTSSQRAGAHPGRAQGDRLFRAGDRRRARGRGHRRQRGRRRHAEDDPRPFGPPRPWRCSPTSSSRCSSSRRRASSPASPPGGSIRLRTSADNASPPCRRSG